MSDAIISADRLAKVYDMGEVQVRALRGVSLDVAAGELIAIMGTSGSGKSTLMNILGCLDRPTSGQYRLAGREVSRLGGNQLADVRNQTLGFVFQSFNLLARTSAVENVELPLIYAGVGGRERRRRAAQALEQVGLSDRAGHLPSALSGGQRQRVAIARALGNEPLVLLADEPTGNLDSAATLDVLRLLDSLRADGQTLVVVTHDARIAATADRLITMRDGAFVEETRLSHGTTRRLGELAGLES